MGNETAWYEERGMDPNRYFELKYIARQYEEYQKKRATAQDKEKAMKYAWRIQAIETAARLATAEDPGILDVFMVHITTGRSYEKLNPPCGQVQFFRKRKKFFLELDKRI